jgi:spore maturation protein B
MSVIETVSLLFIPVFIVFVIVYGLITKTRVYESFVEGAKQGLATSFKVMPYVIAFVFAVGLFRAAGGFDLITKALKPVLEFLNVPGEVIPLVITRPFSGSAALGILASILKESGPDSFAGRVASTVMGSAETIFYTVALYFGSVGISKTRHTVPAALVAEFFGLAAAIIFCSILF